MTDTHQRRASFERAVVKMALAAEQPGLTPRDLIYLLDSGMSVVQILDYIAAKQSGRAVEN
jgi:hypothetical protein